MNIERGAESHSALRIMHWSPELRSNKASDHLASSSFVGKGEDTKNGPCKPAYMYLEVVIKATKDLTKILLRSKIAPV